MTYVGELYDHVVAHRDAVHVMLAATSDAESLEMVRSARRELGELMSQLTITAESFTSQSGLNVPRVDIRVGMSITLIVSVALYGGWFLSSVGPLDRDATVRELAGLIMNGALAEQLPPSLPGPI